MTITRIALILGLGLLPLMAQPGPRGHGMKGGPEHMLGRMADRLKLTDAQKTKIQEIHAKHRDANLARMKANQETRKAFQEAMKDPATPADKLKTLHQAVTDKAFEQMMDRRNLHAEVMAVLTPEQKAEADKLRAFRQGMEAGRMGRRGGFGPRF